MEAFGDLSITASTIPQFSYLKKNTEKWIPINVFLVIFEDLYGYLQGGDIPKQ